MDEAEAIGKAFHVMTIVPNQANDMMDIGRLQGFEVSEILYIAAKRRKKYSYNFVFFLKIVLFSHVSKFQFAFLSV